MVKVLVDAISRMDSDSPVRFGFVCVQNAGRSQMSAAFAERERNRRELTETVQIVTGGTRPAAAVHDEVVAVMREYNIELSDRVPREISTAELESCDVVVTMGCSTLELNAENVDIRDWDLPDPGNEDLENVRAIRDDIQNRVDALFDGYFATEALQQ